MKKLIKTSYSNLNIASLYMSGSHVKLDDWKETLLIDGRPLAVPGANPFIVLPSEIGLQPPSYFASFPYTGLSLYEEYTATSYIVTGWSVSLGKSGLGPAHANPLNPSQLLFGPLTGDFYTRSLTDPNNKTTITPFWIDSGQFFNSGFIPETTISGDTIIGWNIYSGLSGAEDLIVSLRGRYNDINEANVSDGVIMSSGDSAISFFLEYGSITGETILEYYTPNEFIATRWGVYSASTGSSTIGNGDPLIIQEPLSGRFYYRDPKSSSRTTITSFTMPTGTFASFSLIGQDKNILPRQIVGIDIYKGLNNLTNLHIVLGGRAIASANYIKNVVTKDIFDIFSGFITGLVEAGNSGITSLNGSYGPVYLDGISGIKISDNGYPSQTITVEYTSGNFNNIDFAPQNLDLSHKEGRVFYSADTKTLNAHLDIPDVTLNIGQEEYIRIVNKTNNTIPNGTPVYLSGSHGNRPQAWIAMSSGDDSLYHLEHLIGVSTHNISNNEEGLITTNGIINGINTSSFSAGDILYVESSGGLTNILPNALTSYGKKIGYALNSANNGKILVKINDNFVGPYKSSSISLSISGYSILSGASIFNSGVAEIHVPNDFIATGILATCSLASGLAGSFSASNRLSGIIYQKKPSDNIFQRSIVAPWFLTGGNIFSGFSFDSSNSLFNGPTSPILISGGNLLSLDMSGVNAANRYRGINIALLGKSY